MTGKKEAWGSANSPPRLSRKEVRKRVLDVAVRLLSSTGLTVSFEHLSMDELIRQSNVPRASVFRAFGDREGLITELMLRMIRPDKSRGAAFDPDTLAVSEATVQKHRDLLGSADGRQRVLREVVRLGAQQNFNAISDSVYWKTYMALSIALPAMSSERTEEVVEQLRVVERRFIDLMSEYYEGMLVVLGRRTRFGVTTQQIAAAGSAVVEGLVQRQLVNPELVSHPVLLPDINGDLVPWHLAAVGFLMIVENLTEPLSDDEYRAQLEGAVLDQGESTT